MLWKVGVLVLVVVSCSRHGDPPSPQPRIAIDASIDPTRLADAPVDAPADAPAAPRTDAVAFTLDGKSKTIAYGLAFEGGLGDLFVSLYSEPIPCKSLVRGSRAPVGVSITFDLPAGPGGSYFGGHDVWLDFAVETGDTVAVPGGLARASGVSSMPKDLAVWGAATLAPISHKAGARIRGQLDVAEHSMFGDVAIHGPFSVELCEPLDAQGALPASAPGTPLHGKRTGQLLAPRTIHAIVKHQRIDRLELYPKAGVPCPPPGADVVPGEVVLAEIAPIGGTDASHPIFDAPQPTDVSFRKGTESDGIWPSWISISKPLSYVAGEHFHARLSSQAPWFEKRKGAFGGTIDAVVCAG